VEDSLAVGAEAEVVGRPEEYSGCRLERENTLRPGKKSRMASLIDELLAMFQ
jgi:hypothetical protein